MFWKPIISNLRYKASIRNNRVLDSRKLKAYICEASRDNDSRLILQDTNKIRISNIKRIGGGLINNVYSFLLTYSEKDEEKQQHLIIKTYKENVDPVRCAISQYIRDCDLKMCVREWEALRSLESVGFSVPKAYICECDSSVLGDPFLIMAQIERSQKNIYDYIDRFAESLAQLHNLEINSLELKVLKPPKDGYAFAGRWPIHFKHVLNIETKHSKQLKRSFDFAIRWLKSNIPNNYCSKYSLIHGDCHLGNAFLDKNSQITLIDWDSVKIGDPAYDVGNAYHMVKFYSNIKDPDSAEQIAERFLSKYMQKSKVDIRSRLKFYQVVAILGYSIAYSSGLSSPIMAYKYHKDKVLKSIPFLELPLILFAFPFLRWSFIAQKINAETDLYWLKYFKNFIEKLQSSKL